MVWKCFQGLPGILSNLTVTYRRLLLGQLEKTPESHPSALADAATGDAEPGTNAGANSAGRIQGVCLQRLRRSARGPHCARRGDQQADALPLFWRQRGALSGGVAAKNGTASRLGKRHARRPPREPAFLV